MQRAAIITTSTTTTTPTYCARGCTRPLKHLPRCPNACTCDAAQCDHCTGCEPALADEPLSVCRRCATGAARAVRQAAELYADLLTPTRPGPKGGARGIGHEQPLPIDASDDAARPGASDARALLLNLLSAWTLRLVQRHGVRPPRRAMRARLDAEAAAVTREKFAALDAVEPSQRMAHLRAMLLAEREAGRLVITLESVDDVQLMTEHVTKHLPKLLGDADADAVVDDLLHWVALARRRAYPGPPVTARLGDCTCGASVRTLPGEQLVTCPGCGTVGGLDWWHARLIGTAPTTEGPTADYEQLSAWLSHRYGEAIGVTRLRNWANRQGHLVAGRDAKGRTLLHVTATVAYADTLYSPLPTPRQGA